MTPEEFVEAYAPLVRKAVHREHKNSALFTVEDLEQEAWAAMLPYRERLAGESEGFVYKAAQNACIRYASRERESYSYFSGAFVYNVELIRSELEVGAWLTDPGDDWALRMDITAAYENLSEHEQEALYRRYVLGIVPGDSTGRMQVLRAVERMCHWLNGKASIQLVNLDDYAEVA